MKIISIFLLVGFILLLGCAAVKELVQPPSVKIDSVKVTGASFQDISLDFNLLINNPNPFGIQLSGFDYAFSLEGKDFLTGNETRDIRIAATGNSQVGIPIRLDFNKIYKLAKETKSLDSLSYNLKGHFKPGGILAGFQIPFSKTGSLPNVRIPKISFKGLKISKLGFTGIDMVLGIGIENKNIFGFDIGKLDYKIALAGTPVAKGISQNLASIPKKGSGEIKLPISLSFSGLASSLRSALMGKNVDCAIQGTADLNTPFGVFTMPIHAQQKISILK
ncbi:MAG: LEA type 2 family protein [Calditrichaeota bacterium]|nr:LEA type 2 family protein [Calditrichota bacterium]